MIATQETVADLYRRVRSKLPAPKLPHSFSLMKKPVQLIRVRESMLEICEDGIRLLSKVKLPMKSVGIFGKPLSGKGLLLNILAGKLGQAYMIKTENAKTPGIWIWGSEASQATLYIDCITLSEKFRGENARLIALMTMLSSVVIYNSLGPISHTDLKSLNALAFMQKISGDDNVITDTHFIWVLRSFQLNLEGENGPITTNEYMHEVLQNFSSSKPGLGLSNMSDLYATLNRLFVSINCVALTRPTFDKSQLNTYETLQMADLEPLFVSQIRELMSEIEGKLTNKLLFGVPMTGTMTAYMLGELVSRINSDMPIVSEALQEMLTEAELKHLLSKAKETYYSELDLDFEILPTSEAELCKVLLKARQKAEAILSENLTFTPLLKAKAYEEVNAIAENTQRYWNTVNAELSDVYNQALADRLLKPVKAITGEAITQDSYQHYLNRWNTFIEYYKVEARGVNRLRPVMKFLSENQTSSFYKYISRELENYTVSILATRTSKAAMTRTKADLETKLQETISRAGMLNLKVGAM